MKEIEDLEKRMDTTGAEEPKAAQAPEAATDLGASLEEVEETAAAAATEEKPAAVQQTQASRDEAEDEEDEQEEEKEEKERGVVEDPNESPLAYTPLPPAPAKVVPMRPSLAESLAETDAIPARDEPLVRGAHAAAREDGLSMKIGGCSDVNLEFTRAGLTVTLNCSEDTLTITTDQGAEFRIPFKRTA